MNDIQIFSNSEFGSVRTIEENGQILFCGSDVAMALGYSNPRDAVKRHCKVDGVVKRDGVSLTKNQYGKYTEQKVVMNFISEPNLYRLICNSKLKSAERFEKWVFEEVLPTIRKHGSYSKPKTSIQLLEMELKAIKEVDEKIETVNQDLQDFKQDMPILGIEIDQITSAVKRKGVEVLGGKDSNAYKSKSIRGKVYSDIYRELKRNFGVTTYKAIKRKECELAVRAIGNYSLPRFLELQIRDENAQENMTL